MIFSLDMTFSLRVSLVMLVALPACDYDVTSLGIVQYDHHSAQLIPQDGFPTAAEALTVSVVTWVPDCYVFGADETLVQTDGSDIVIVPYVHYDVPDEDTTCLRILGTVTNVATIKLDSPGDRTIRVRGLHVEDATLPPPSSGERIAGEVIDLQLTLHVN